MQPFHSVGNTFSDKTTKKDTAFHINSKLITKLYLKKEKVINLCQMHFFISLIEQCDINCNFLETH